MTILVTSASVVWQASRIEKDFSTTITKVSTVLDGVVKRQEEHREDIRDGAHDRSALWLKVGELDSRLTRLEMDGK